MKRIPDVIVVGGGSAGAVLAAELAKDGKRQVLLIESGRRPLPILHSLPIFAGPLSQGVVSMWRDITEPENQLGGRRLPWPHGRVLGGSSSINGMVWMRGRPSDYERWRQAGADGWGWDAVRPVFDELDGGKPGRARIPTNLHPGANPLYEAFIAAGEAAGHKHSSDFNTSPYEGIGRYTLNVLHGQRFSAARAFLRHSPPNLTILTGATALGLRLSGQRVAGVIVARRRNVSVLNAGEVVLSAGTINTPKLLMLSGIGPTAALEAAGIGVRHDLPGVGENLQDHLCGRLAYACRLPVTLRNLMRADRALIAGLEGVLFGRGDAAASPFGVGVLMRSRPEEPEPDIQGFLIPGLSDYRIWFPGVRPARRGHGFLASVYQLRPESRGRITLRDAEPNTPPKIVPNYLSAGQDREVLRRGMLRMAEILANSALDPFRGERISQTDPTDEAGFAEALGREAATAFHAVGTCRIGRADDRLAVVTPDLRVRGMEGLRIADASVMPSLTSGNTNAPSMMIGMRAAALMV